MIEERQIQEIVDKTDIVGLVSEYVTLSKRGKNYFGLCPFHDDSNPSFSVSQEKKIAKCMTCGEGGNPINFLRKIKNISFEDACVELGKRVGITINSTKKVEFVDHHQKYYEINDVAQKFYQHFLHNTQSGQEALNYLYKRGLTLETIKMFGIGLAPKEHDKLFQVLTDKGYSSIDLEDLGLVKNHKNGYYDMFNNRIMFPIIDDNNHVLGFSGRIYYPSDNEPKYVNTAETVIYKKGEMLYNLNNAISTIRKTRTVILCEGQMDVIAMSNAGIKNAVCSLGTALTNEQVSLLKKYAQNIIIAYDGDNAGIKATTKAFKLLSGFKATTITLPNGMDPDEYIKTNGSDSLRNFIINNQKDYYEFSYQNAFYNRSIDNNFDYEAIKADVFKLLSEVKSTSLVEKYLIRLSNELKISYEAIFNDYNLYSNKGYNPNFVEIKDENVKKEKNVLPHEKIFLALNIASKDYYDYFLDRLPKIEEHLQHEYTIQTYGWINYFYGNGDTDQTRLIRCCSQEVNKDFIFEIMKEIEKIMVMEPKKVTQIMDDIIGRLKDISFRNSLDSFLQNTANLTDENNETLQQVLSYARKKYKSKKAEE